jgi:hypothetical protein
MENEKKHKLSRLAFIFPVVNLVWIFLYWLRKKFSSPLAIISIIVVGLIVLFSIAFMLLFLFDQQTFPDSSCVWDWSKKVYICRQPEREPL